MPPYLLLVLLLGLIYGLLFYLWQGQTWRDLGLYVFTGLMGVVVGQIIGRLLNSNLWPIGLLHGVEATIMSGLWLFVARWIVGKYRSKRETR